MLIHEKRRLHHEKKSSNRTGRCFCLSLSLQFAVCSPVGARDNKKNSVLRVRFRSTRAGWQRKEKSEAAPGAGEKPDAASDA